MKFLILPAVLFSACLCFGGGVRMEEHRDALESYPDPGTGVVFPAEINGFRKKEVIQNYNPFLGTQIRYLDNEGHCADIYLYMIGEPSVPITAESAKKHFHDICGIIRRLPARNQQVTRSELLQECEYRYGKTVSGYKALFNLQIGQEPACRTVMILFPFKDRIVKLRLSGSAHLGGDAFPKMNEFCDIIALAFENAR